QASLTVRVGLFAPQRIHRVGAGGATRREPRGAERDFAGDFTPVATLNGVRSHAPLSCGTAGWPDEYTGISPCQNTAEPAPVYVIFPRRGCRRSPRRRLRDFASPATGRIPDRPYNVGLPAGGLYARPF